MESLEKDMEAKSKAEQEENHRHEVICWAIDRLSSLTKEDFHGYRSEIYNVLLGVYKREK